MKPMKRAVTFRLSVALSLTAAILVINGCKKETPVKNITPVTVNSEPVDSAVYFKGYFDGAPISFEGNATAYHAFVDPDSAEGGYQVGGNQSHDNDAFYQSGSKWMNLTNAGIMTVNASLELRSLAVRVFVSPLANASTTYFNLLSPTAYPISTGQSGSQGAFITLHDKNGVMWTTHGDQDESTLVILTRGANMTTYTVVSGTVSCKLYDGEGNMKKLTAAQFTASVGI
jgi:hypothetical protein